MVGVAPILLHLSLGVRKEECRDFILGEGRFCGGSPFPLSLFWICISDALLIPRLALCLTR